MIGDIKDFAQGIINNPNNRFTSQNLWRQGEGNSADIYVDRRVWEAVHLQVQRLSNASQANLADSEMYGTNFMPVLSNQLNKVASEIAMSCLTASAVQAVVQAMYRILPAPSFVAGELGKIAVQGFVQS
jgi:hypothetical protein